MVSEIYLLFVLACHDVESISRPLALIHSESYLGVKMQRDSIDNNLLNQLKARRLLEDNHQFQPFNFDERKNSGEAPEIDGDESDDLKIFGMEHEDDNDRYKIPETDDGFIVESNLHRENMQVCYRLQVMTLLSQRLGLPLILLDDPTACHITHLQGGGDSNKTANAGLVMRFGVSQFLAGELLRDYFKENEEIWSGFAIVFDEIGSTFFAKQNVFCMIFYCMLHNGQQ